MCLQDIVIGRASISGQETFTVGTTVGRYLNSQPERTSIIFCPPNAGTVTWSTKPNPVAGEGLVIEASDSPFGIDIAKYGGLIIRPWFPIADAADRVCTVLTSALPLDLHDVISRIREFEAIQT